MTGYPQNGRARRPANHSWLLAAWGVPLAVAAVITIATAGFGALTFVVAIVVGVVATALHLGQRGS